MPQLDANTFLYQYVGVISVLFVLYILLGYVALPILLRAISLRNKFLINQSGTDTLNMVSSFNAAALHVNSVTNFSKLITSVVLNFSKSVVELVTLFSISFSTVNVNNGSSTKIDSVIFFSESFLIYLVLFLESDEELI